MHDVLIRSVHTKQANWAFFPVLPYLVRFLSNGAKDNAVVIAYFLNNLFLLIAFIYLFKYLTPRYSPRVVKVTLVFIALSPVNVYFMSFYTEAIFFALLIMTVYHIKKHKWIIAGILGALLSGSRNTGIFMILIYIVEYWQSPELHTSRKLLIKYLTGLLIFPTGIVLFMVHLKSVMGDPLAFYHIEATWGGPHGNYFTFILRTLREREILQFVDVLVLFIAIVSCIYFFRNRRITEFLVLFPVTLISFDSSRIHYRFYFAIYPIYILIATLVENRKWAYRVVLGIEFLLLILSIKLWITGYGPT